MLYLLLYLWPLVNIYLAHNVYLQRKTTYSLSHSLEVTATLRVHTKPTIGSFWLECIYIILTINKYSIQTYLHMPE